MLYVLGNVPGAPGAVVKVRDAVKKIERQLWDLQYPTYLGDLNNYEENVITWDGGELDPFENFWHDNDVVSGTPEGGD